MQNKTDILIVGAGWAGSLLARELVRTGLHVTMLERGGNRNFASDFGVPFGRDELRFAVRNEMMQSLQKETITFRNNVNGKALPMRQLGAFLPGTGVGGAGAHWNGIAWRWGDMEFKVRSQYEEMFGRSSIPGDVLIEDWPVDYAALEPYYDEFEYLCGVSGKAGNIGGQIQTGGNPYEAPRKREYPLPPLEPGLAGEMFAATAKQLGYKPFPRAAAMCSRAYTNPEGVSLAPCDYCGFCARYGCASNSKATPENIVLPRLMSAPNFSLMTNTQVLKIIHDGTSARGVEYIDTMNGKEGSISADMVIIAGFTFTNVHLLLHSGIGKPYNPADGKGWIGRNYCYQLRAKADLFFENAIFNPFMAAGGSGNAIDDFNANLHWNRGSDPVIGGAVISAGHTGGAPIQSQALPDGVPPWGSEWKAAMAKWYNRNMGLDARISNMPHAQNYFDLDPAYRDGFGRPLLRMTYNYQDNDRKLYRRVNDILGEFASAMKADHTKGGGKSLKNWNIRNYQSTHNAGGAVMGRTPEDGAVNQYGQIWDMHNLFVIGASMFRHNSAYNPTMLVAALAIRSGEAIREKYVSRPGLIG